MRPTRVEVDLGHIVHNLSIIRRRAGPGVQVMAVVKADAYGHGAEAVSRAAVAGGASWLGVAMVEEGLSLRKAGITAPILVMGWTSPEQALEAARSGLVLTVTDLEHARLLSSALAGKGCRLRVHVKVDTGMGRLGIPAGLPLGHDGQGLGEAARAVAEVCRLEGLEAEGIYTHFAAADEDRGFTLRQAEQFAMLLEKLRLMGVEFAIKHAANSAAVWDYPEAYFDMVRAGISLYGYHPAGCSARAHGTLEPKGDGGRAGGWEGLKPALEWKTAVAQVKEVPAGTSISYGRTFVTGKAELVATLPVGYADGFSRGLSNRGWVLIRGRRAPVVGRVCMDQTMVLVSEAGRVAPGEEVILIGRQGGEAITADDLAEWLGTISYEVLCGIGKRVPRFYRGQGGGISL